MSGRLGMDMVSGCRSWGSKAECGRREEIQKSDHQPLHIRKMAPKWGDTAGAGRPLHPQADWMSVQLEPDRVTSSFNQRQNLGFRVRLWLECSCFSSWQEDELEQTCVLWASASPQGRRLSHSKCSIDLSYYYCLLTISSFREQRKY